MTALQNARTLTLVISGMIDLTYWHSFVFLADGSAVLGRGMTRKPDREYYAARLNAEREAAARAATEAARAAHQTLAEEYAARLDGGGTASAGEARS